MTAEADPNPMLPVLADVADKLYARTVTRGGVYVGTFNAETNPTKEKVERYIASATNEVLGRTGRDIDPEEVKLVGKVRETIAIYAAMLVELSHYPDQIRNGRSSYPELKELFEANMLVLTDATGLGASGSPLYAFPPTSIGDGVMP